MPDSIETDAVQFNPLDYKLDSDLADELSCGRVPRLAVGVTHYPRDWCRNAASSRTAENWINQAEVDEL